MLKPFQKLSLRLQSQLDNFEKIYIIPTKFGIAFFSVNFISFIIALAFGHQFSYIFSISLLVIFVTSAMITNQYMKNILVKTTQSFVISSSSDDVFLPISLENHEEEVVDINIISVEKNIEVQSNHPSCESQMPLGKKSVGVYETHKLKMNSTYPLFLFKAWKSVDLKASVVIYPKSSLVQRNEGSTTNDSINEIEHIKYRVGDNLSKVDWKIYARKGELFSKVDIGNNAQVFIIDESIILKYGDDGLGLVCHLIHEHIKKGHAFIFKTIHNKDVNYTKTLPMVNLLKDLVKRNYDQNT